MGSDKETRKGAAITSPPEKPNLSAKGRWVWEPEHRVHFKEGYLIMFQAALDEVSRDPDISGETLRVWMQLLSRLEDKNWLHVQQSAIAEAMQMKASNVSRSIKLLVQKGYLEEGPKVGRNKSYRISPKFSWKGYGEDYTKEKSRRAHLQLVEYAKAKRTQK